MSALELTLLRCPSGQLLAKRWSLPGPVCRPYDEAYNFAVAVAPVGSISDLRDLLQWLGGMPDYCVIRGAPAPGINLSNTVRRSKEKDGQAATFLSVPRQWFCLDLDHIDPRTIPDIRTSSLDAVQCVLPHCLRGVSTVWQWSASAGMRPDKAGLHLWYLIDRPIGETVLKLFLASIGGDVSLTRCVQPHFTAAPIFDPPLVDPLRERVGLLRGDRDTVDGSVLIAAHGAAARVMEYEEGMARMHRIAKRVHYESTHQDEDDGERPWHQWATCEEVVKHLRLVTEHNHKELLCNCRRHQSTSKKSLTVDIEKNTWFCFGCNKGGGAKDLIMWQYGPTMAESNAIWLLRLIRQAVGCRS